jgi:hypothetical protein
VFVVRPSLPQRESCSVELFPWSDCVIWRELKPESVAGKAREDVQVYVEDVLSGCGTVCEEEVDTLATQHRLPQRCAGTFRHAEELCAILRIEFGE